MSLNIFITGASSGIGESLAYYYSQIGCTIGIVARRKNRLLSVANECKKLGGNPIVYNIDVSDKEKCIDAAKDFVSINRGIDIVIANAGVGGDDNIISGDPSEINKILKIGDRNLFLKSLKAFICFNKIIVEIGAGTCQWANYLAIGTNNNVFSFDSSFNSNSSKGVSF